MSLQLAQSEYREIRTDHVFENKTFTEQEPSPICAGWNHGDGSPDWKNSGWIYDGILYACAFDSAASAAIGRKLNHQYAIDYEKWADATIAALRERLRLAEAVARQSADFLFWFNADGSPCDGFRFQEERVTLETMLREGGYTNAAWTAATPPATGAAEPKENR